MPGGVPPAVTRLLKARYPTLTVDLTWLEGCVAYLRQSHDGPLTDDQLAKQVRIQLLSADLADVASSPALDANIFNSRDAPKKASIGQGPRQAVLLQIVSMMDIGVSASSQLEVALARKAARSTLGDADLIKSASTEAEEEDHMAEFNATEEQAGRSNLVHPRKMLKLELSDGKSAFDAIAIEHDRVKGFDMNTTPLGCKVLLKGAEVHRGYINLNDKCCVVEGGEVQHLQEDAEQKLINMLRGKLGMPPLEDDTSREAQAASSLPPAVKPSTSTARSSATAQPPPSSDPIKASSSRTARPQRPPPPAEIDVFSDDETLLGDAILDASEMEKIEQQYMQICTQEARRSKSPTRPTRSSGGKTKSPSSSTGRTPSPSKRKKGLKPIEPLDEKGLERLRGEYLAICTPSQSVPVAKKEEDDEIVFLGGTTVHNAITIDSSPEP